ncbi:WD repeat-containing protein on Y chromosome-like isoform X2 [Patiria miniata]|uniref:WD repeat-containing protein on Y chromosome n=1 Tax=Patiria miniata TaxID=46514 RepID=A0A914BSN6_PATMI|nr:WD repeat-containing protein on Y chromosome-like isoform X2 [Patiria miniata]
MMRDSLATPGSPGKIPLERTADLLTPNRKHRSSGMKSANSQRSAFTGSSAAFSPYPQVSKGSMAGKHQSDQASQAGSMGARLEDEMNNDHLQKLQEIFEEADEDGGGGLDIDEFRQAMRKIMGEGMMEEVDDKELAIVFMKVDANCDGTVDWDEYLSYMLMEYQERDHMSNLFKEIPFPKPLREIHSNHRDMLTKVGFYQNLNLRHGNLHEEGEHGGRYISVSKEGVINFWSMDMHLQRSVAIEQPREKTKPMWLTDMVCMPNVNMIAVSSTERDISFYDVNATKFDRCFQVSGLDNCALTMDYWFDPRNMNKAVLVFGDAGGNVCCIVFTEAMGSALFGSQNAKSVGSRRVPFPELLKGSVKGVVAMKFSPLHEDWVRKVKYCSNLNSFISCATTNESSIYIGDLSRKKSGSFFKIRKGILCFDYCKETNMIVTGGMDRSVRTWNPYVTTKATSVMKGHTSAVVHIVVNSTHGQIISVGKDKGVKVWDMRDQTCMQNINPRSINMGPHSISTVCFHAKTGSLILGTNQIALLEHKWDADAEDDDVTSHNRPITAAIYNHLFNQVVSACHDSVVSVWDLATGTKTIMFSKAHKYMEKGVEKCAEITAMTFDPSYRRLVTGGRDGSVKIWNFNNGACLRELETFDTMEVTGIVCPKQRIVTAGWNRRVTSYIDSDDDDDSRQWMLKHNEDILSLAAYDTSIIATSSYDGDIIIWSLETAQPLCRLNASDGVSPRTGSRTINYSSKTAGSSTKSADVTRLTRRRSAASNASSASDADSSDGVIGKHKASSHKTLLKRQSTKALFDPVETSKAVNDSEDEPSYRRTSLPAIGTPKASFVNTSQKRSEGVKEDSQTFFTESMSNFKQRAPSGRTASSSRKSFYVDVEDSKEYTKKHESAVDKVIFLQSRPNDKDTATLMASGADGWVRAWSVHHKGGLLGQFNAAQKGGGESVLAMTTDSENEFLITGDTSGYIMVWDITDYCIGSSTAPQARVPSAALQHMRKDSKFPFRGGNPTILKLQERMEKKQRAEMKPPPSATNPRETIKWPKKLNSFRAHVACVTHIEYCEDKSLIVSSSDDCSVRLWTLCGRYIGTFGQFGGWQTLPEEVIPKELPRRLPRDVHRVASAVTLKVLNGGIMPRWKLAKNIMMIVARNQLAKAAQGIDDSSLEGDDGKLLGEKAHDSGKASLGTSTILGKSYKPKTRHKMPPTLPEIKQNQNQVVVYSSLPFTDLEPVEEIKVPTTLHEIQLRQQQSMEAMRGAENGLAGGALGKKHGGKRSRLQEFLQKQKAVRILTKGKLGLTAAAAAANKGGK